MTASFKERITRLRYPFYILAGIFAMVSCTRDENEPVSENEILVSQSVVFTYPLATIQSAMAAQAAIYPEAQEIVEHIKYGVKVYRVSYRTLYRDSVITASGLVCMPESEGSFPVISFQNGTNTSHNNAPSVNPANSGYLVMEIMASNGYIVLIPDYIGFGTSSAILHPYYHRESTNNAVIDLLRALKELENSSNVDAVSNDSLFLLGYSQGGEATISVADELESNNRTAYDLIAVSAGAGAYDLMDFSNYVFGLESFPSPMYFPYFIYSQIKYGAITAPLSLFFNEPYASDIPELFNGSNDNDGINSALTSQITGLLTPQLIQNFAEGNDFAELRTALTSNSIEGWNTSLEIKLFHGTADDNVPPEQSFNLYNEFISAGTDPRHIEHIPMEGLTHGTGLFPWGISSINWFNSLRN